MKHSTCQNRSGFPCRWPTETYLGHFLGRKRRFTRKGTGIYGVALILEIRFQDGTQRLGTPGTSCCGCQFSSAHEQKSRHNALGPISSEKGGLAGPMIGFEEGKVHESQCLIQLLNLSFFQRRRPPTAEKIVATRNRSLKKCQVR